MRRDPGRRGGGGQIERYEVAPEDVGLERPRPTPSAGGTPDENAATTRAIFAGEAGAARDLAVLNAGAAIYAGGRAETLPRACAAAEAASTPARRTSARPLVAFGGS